MGTLVTLELPADSPVRDLPWIITIGPLHDDDEWEPVVCGPYERSHALGLAEAVVADEELMAVVEPLLPLIDPAAIAEEIELARAAVTDDPLDEDLADDDAEALTDQPRQAPPTADDVRAGFARIAARLTRPRPPG